jgi:hypothetical protein
MTRTQKHLGILNLEGREPIGAVLAIGIKDKTKGFPTETDRFHLVNPRENNGIRDLHIVFNPFNSAPIEKRKVIHGNLVHATRAECFEFQLKAQVLSKSHPNRMPCCIGNGEKATRWMGGAADNFKEIICPHDRCEFRQTKPPLCKPFMRFLFRLRWDKSNGFAHMPELLVKFTSGSWNTTSNVKGFFDYIETTARNLGLQNYTLFGLPFMMTLAYQTKPSDKTRFPVVTITPEADPVSFFIQQQENIRLLRIPVAITSGEEQAVDVVYEDVKGVSGNGISIPTQLEKTTTMPVDERSQKKIEQPLISQKALLKSAVLSETGQENGHIRLYPDDWDKIRDKTDKKIESKWKDLKGETLVTMVAGKGDQRQSAINELRYRIVKFGELYTKIGQKDDWEGATCGGDVAQIPIAELAGVAKQLFNGWKKLSEKK